MGLTINVYRDADGHDCTMNGISSRFKELTVVNVSGPSEPTEDRPPVLLENHVRGALRIVPALKNDVTGEWVKAPGWFMMGGNYGATSDSRFSEKCAALLGNQFYGAVPIHDRQE